MSSKKAKQASKETKEMSYQIRDIVLGKIRGYPPWPGMVVDPDNVPSTVTSERPASKKTTFYCVRFFPTGDYAWLVPKDISKLQTHEIESYINEPFKKSADLLQGYRVALDPRKWEEEHDALATRAVEAEANAEIDQLEESEAPDDDEEPKKKTKKRKRESEPASAAGAASVGGRGRKKQPKEKKEKDENGNAANASTNGGVTKKKQATASAAGKKRGPKSKHLVESEDDGDHAEAASAPVLSSKKAQVAANAASPPPAKKAKREKDEEDEPKDGEATKVRDWRHKLQKAFLGKTAPREEDMPALDQLFTTVEEYEGMTVEYLTFSKIGKVMRHIAVLTDDKVPLDGDFKFRERAKTLVDRWHQILNANKSVSAAPAALSTAQVLSAAPAAVVNGGDHEKSEEKEEMKDGKEDKAAKDVTEATANIDLNGKQSEEASPAADAPSTAGEDAPADADASTADVTMSEA